MTSAVAWGRVRLPLVILPDGFGDVTERDAGHVLAASIHRAANEERKEGESISGATRLSAPAAHADSSRVQSLDDPLDACRGGTGTLS